MLHLDILVPAVLSGMTTLLLKFILYAEMARYSLIVSKNKGIDEPGSVK